MSDELVGSLMPLGVAIPLTASVLALLASRLSARLALWVAVTGLVGAAGVVATVVPATLDGRVVVHYLGHWVPLGGQALGIGFAADGFGVAVALAASGVGAILLIFALSELGDFGDHEVGYFAALFLLLDAGIVGAALTADLFNIFVWFEVAALASYGLTAFLLDRPPALEAALKMVVLTTLASFAIFVGAGLLYSGHGALNLAQLHQALAQQGVHRFDRVAVGLLIGGFATKAGLIPFHGWLPDAHSAAPGAVSALFSGLMVNLGLVGVARVALQVAPSSEHLLGVVTILGLASCLVGAALATVQDDLKRLLAYDTVSQIGLVAVALATGTHTGETGAVYHLVNHALYKSLLFLCAGAIIHTTGVTNLSEMGGLAARLPAVAAVFVLGVACLAGVPPLNGYGSHLLIHEALIDGHHYGVLAGIVIADILTVAALARAAWLAFFRPRSEPYENLQHLRPGMVVALSGLSVLCVAAGVLASPASRAASRGATALIEPRTWAEAVLGGAGRLSSPPVHIHYLSPTTLAMTAGVLVAGLWLGRRVTTRRPPLVGYLQAWHTGLVNDYAVWAASGTVLVIFGLLLVGA